LRARQNSCLLVLLLVEAVGVCKIIPLGKAAI